MRRERGPRSAWSRCSHGLAEALLLVSRDVVKSSAQRGHRKSSGAYHARGITWTLFMRQERGPVCEHAIDVWRGQRKSLPDDHSAKCEATMFFFAGGSRVEIQPERNCRENQLAAASERIFPHMIGSWQLLRTCLHMIGTFDTDESLCENSCNPSL